MTPEEIKNQVVENQEIIDALNERLKRKTQEVTIIQEISAEINTSLDLDIILNNMLKSLDTTFGFNHSMILLMDQSSEALKVAASYGYKDEGLGVEVKIGQGVIGVVAKRKKLMRMGNIGAQMNYMTAVKTQMEDNSDVAKLPGLNNVQSQVAIPLLNKEDLIGVLAVESDKPNLFDKKDELIVTILADQAASAIVKAKAHSDLKELNEHLEDKVKERTEEVVRQKEDTIYASTDGYADQFGGSRGKKLKYKPFKELLLSMQNQSMEEQKVTLLNSFNKWRGNLEQVDDVCVIGVKI